MNIFQNVYSSCAGWLIKKIHDHPYSSLHIEHRREILGSIIMREIGTKVENLLTNVDDTSKKVIQITINNLIKELTSGAQPYEFSPFQVKHFPLYKKEKNTYKQYKLKPAMYFSDVFYSHHGLRFCNSKIREYVKGKGVLDCGAYIGDSAIILSKYCPSKIFCFEFSEPSIKCLKKNIAKNHIENLVEIIPYALSNESYTYEDVTKLSPATKLLSLNMQPLPPPQSSQIVVKRLDDILPAETRVGFVKADVEGALLCLLKGGVDTIVHNRPVLSFSIYHTPEEIFETKPFLESILDDYVFEFHHGNFDETILDDLSELTLFAYPKEIL